MTTFMRRVADLYVDGFRSMTVGRKLWALIIIKLILLFGVMKLFFFPNILNERYDNDADKAAAQLVDIRSRLEALGGAALGNSEERLIQAMADIEAFNDRVQRLEQASVKLSGAILAYMKQAISEDANARTAVESSLRLLESVLGYRQQPVRDGAGTLAEAKVLSIDSESGVVVLNTGRTAGMQVGMPVRLTRGAQTIGEAVVTDVRKEVCGALVQKLETPADPVRVGDSASVKTND